MMGLVQKTMMLEQELAMLKQQKHDSAGDAAEVGEGKEVDAAMGVMFNGTQTMVERDDSDILPQTYALDKADQ